MTQQQQQQVLEPATEQLPPASGQLPPLPSVGHEAMDSEHEVCQAALAALLHSPSRQALLAVQRVLVAHFAHEEELMRAAGFGGQVCGCGAGRVGGSGMCFGLGSCIYI